MGEHADWRGGHSHRHQMGTLLRALMGHLRLPMGAINVSKDFLFLTKTQLKRFGGSAPNLPTPTSAMAAGNTSLPCNSATMDQR